MEESRPDRTTRALWRRPSARESTDERERMVGTAPSEEVSEAVRTPMDVLMKVDAREGARRRESERAMISVKLARRCERRAWPE